MLDRWLMLMNTATVCRWNLFYKILYQIWHSFRTWQNINLNQQGLLILIPQPFSIEQWWTSISSILSLILTVCLAIMAFSQTIWVCFMHDSFLWISRRLKFEVGWKIHFYNILYQMWYSFRTVFSNLFVTPPPHCKIKFNLNSSFIAR